MRFRKGARLDPSQVEDYRGRGRAVFPAGCPSRSAAAAGSSGSSSSLAFLFLVAEAAASATSGRSTGQTVGPRAAVGRARAGVPDRCGRERARGLSHRRGRQQRPGVLDGALRGYEPTRTRFFDGGDPDRLRPGVVGDGPVLLPARPLRLHRPRVLRPAPVQLGAAAGRSPRRTSSRTSTATTSRT